MKIWGGGHHVGNLTYLINEGGVIQKGMALTVTIIQYQMAWASYIH